MDNQNGSSDGDGEDIPSDFFDDFTKEDFIEGLSVVDSWDDNGQKRIGRPRISAEDVDKAKDLRELIARDKHEGGREVTDNMKRKPIAAQSDESTINQKRSSSVTRLDDYIKPGSRRDPNKTNQAIKKDKEEKVKEFLAKHLESSDDIRPPGTELDDFFESKKEQKELKKQPSEEQSSPSPPLKERVKYRRESPFPKRKNSPKELPFRLNQPPPYYKPKQFPFKRNLLVRGREPWNSKRPYSPRRSPRRVSPRRSSPRRSPRRVTPIRYRKVQRSSPRRHSPDVRRYNSDARRRSPVKSSYRRSRSRSRSPNHKDRELRRHSSSQSRNRPEEDDFLYPKDYYPPKFPTSQPEIQFPATPLPQYTEPMIVEYPGGDPSGFPYPQGGSYPGFPAAPYEYGGQPSGPMMGSQAGPPMMVPQPGPRMMVPQPGPPMMVPQPVPAPSIPLAVPTPDLSQSGVISTNQSLTPRLREHVKSSPADPLAKLVADGIISHEDYLKLVPNKGVKHTSDSADALVLNRCNVALSKLGSIMLPARLIINNNMLTAGGEDNPTHAKFCSPLKRQPPVQFNFTKTDASSVNKRNKQIVETVISSLQLENIVGKPKKKPQNNMKDAETQTMKPFCDVCEIRESTMFNEIGTSIDREHITSSVHTQVVDHDLVSSKAVFNPSGSVADSAPMSIAHMTPAQLVSQLAARAKTLKQSDSPSPQYRNQHNYEGRGGGGGGQFQHHGNNYNNYRY
ncbi:serine/arginine repetitive matrix protein 1 [Bicyclus anynana]|uniref:Serine/arginine repetitive matrix protein 1 n=1 Tax=Bicyclus anynana TaxID=110368 RepID=A0A6J1P3R7_BICAN|nr:serine/arginine repetitive matrix protein 1 [Bicyclus anynana]